MIVKRIIGRVAAAAAVIIGDFTAPALAQCNQTHCCLDRTRLRRRMLDRLSHEQGLTLVELQVIVVIMGGLSVITFPAFLNQKGRAEITTAQNTVLAAARACAAAQITGEHAEWQERKPTNVDGTCAASGTLSSFTVAPGDFNLTTAPSATVASTGEVALATCATAPGWFWSTGAAACLGGAGRH